MDQLTASVLVNNRNYGRYLRRAIESAINQDYKALEVIVVDDFSTDDSADIIRDFGDTITSVLKTENGGQGSAINAAFGLSHGDVIFILDSDDEYRPDKVKTVMDVFANHPEVGSVFHEVDRVRDEEVQPPMRLPGDGVVDAREETRHGRPPFLPTPTVGSAYARKLFELLLPMPEYPGVGVGDHYLKWTGLLNAPTFFFDQRLAVQRLHEDNWYSFRGGDIVVGRARIELLNAIVIYQRFPHGQALCERLFLQATRAAGDHEEIAALADGFLALLTIADRRRLLARRRMGQVKSGLRRVKSLVPR